MGRGLAAVSTLTSRERKEEAVSLHGDNTERIYSLREITLGIRTRTTDQGQYCFTESLNPLCREVFVFFLKER